MKTLLFRLTLAFLLAGCETQYANVAKGYTISVKVSPDSASTGAIVGRILGSPNGFRK